MEPDPLAPGGWRIAFDSDEAAEALEFYLRVLAEPWTDSAGRLRRGYAFQDSSELERRWTDGDIAMRFEYLGEQLFAQINPDLTGMAPVPSGPRGGRAGELNCRMLGLFAGIRSKAVRDAAWEFIRFFDGAKARAIRMATFVEAGYARFVHPRLMERYGYAAELRLASRECAEAHRMAVDTGRPEPYGPGALSVYDLLTRPIEAGEAVLLAGRLSEDPAARLVALRGLLAETARRAEREMLGLRAPGELRRRRTAAAVALSPMAAGFAPAGRRVARTLRRAVSPSSGRRGRGALWLLAPAAVGIAVRQYLPLLRGSLMALQDYRIMGGLRWVGLDRFGDLIFDGDWWRAVATSLKYSGAVVALTFLPPLALAILLHEVPHGRSLFRTLWYLPAALGGLVMTLLW